MSGTRLNTKLEDLAASISVITKEQMADFALLDANDIKKTMRLADTALDPWWLDNGPLAPGGFSIEYPIAMGPDPTIDPPATDLYNTRAYKYPWAPDTYVAFPPVVFTL